MLKVQRLLRAHRISGFDSRVNTCRDRISGFSSRVNSCRDLDRKHYRN
uniref:Uncharacterized protein n=1 Tax=Rhizophora mucronata TaxID=61149 RepID=A0A2P2PM47_RHIMU